MFTFELFNDSALTSVATNVVCGTFTNARMYTVGQESSPVVYVIRDEDNNEIDRVTAFAFESCDIIDSTANAFPIGQPAGSEPANFQYYYTAGKTKIGVKYWRTGDDENGYYDHIIFEYPYILNNGTYIELPFTNSTQFDWIYHRTIPLDMFEFLGVYFFSGTFTYDGNTYTLVFPSIKVRSVYDETIVEYWGFRGYTTNIVNGYGNIEQYQPTGNNTRLGGTGNGQYNGAMPETINISARNAAFSITSTNGDGLTYYYIDGTSLNQIVSYVYGSHIFHDSDKILNAVVSAHILPILYVPTTANIGRVFLANVTRSVNTAHIITNRLVSGSMGTVDLTNSGYDDFNDFENTTASLYLPFVGRITIDIHAISRGIMTVDYVVDLFTGNIGYWVYTQSKDAVYPVLYGTYSGNCAVEIPLCGSGRTGNMLGKILNAGSQIATGFAESKVKGAIEVYNAAQSFSDRIVNKSGANDVNSGTLVPYQCRLDIERKEVIRTADYAELNGIPAFDTVKLNTLSGFVKVQTVDLSGIVCEQSERDELRRLLEEGVYI